jgi:hypothetical protein
VVIVCLLKPPTNLEHELHWLLMTTSTNFTLAKTNVNHDELNVFIWFLNFLKSMMNVSAFRFKEFDDEKEKISNGKQRRRCLCRSSCGG